MSVSLTILALSNSALSGVASPLTLAQNADGAASGRVVWAVTVLVALGTVLLLTVLLLVLIGSSRRSRLQSEAARRKRIVTVGEDAWEEAGRRARLADDDDTGETDD